MLCRPALSLALFPLIAFAQGDYKLSLRFTIPIAASGRTVAADLNGDGRPDLITQTVAGFAVRLNDGSGNFFPPVTYPAPNPPGSFAVADFDRDGRLDIAATSSPAPLSNAPPAVYLYRGDGKGGFAEARRTSAVAYSNSTTLVTADFNGDGFPDLANTSPRGLETLLGNGSGDFRNIPNAFTESFPGSTQLRAIPADLNSDGKSDLVLFDVSVGLLISDGSGHFNSSQIIRRDILIRPSSVVLGDFDGSGQQQLAISYYIFGSPNHLEIWKKDASGQFAALLNVDPNQPSQSQLAVADIDADGNLDIVSSSFAGTTVYFGNGSGAFPRTSSMPGASGAPLVVDLDGDGLPEIITYSNQKISVLGKTKPPSRLQLTRDSSNPFTYGTVEFLTATLRLEPSALAPPTGTVTLSEGASQLAVAPLANSMAHFSLQLSPGLHRVRADYSGDAQYGPETADLTLAEAGRPALLQALPVQSILGFTNLQVRVTDAFGDPIGGVGVLFTAPEQEPTGTFLGSPTALVITSLDGVAVSPLFITHGNPGPYSVSAAVSGYPLVTTSIPLMNLPMTVPTVF